MRRASRFAPARRRRAYRRRAGSQRKSAPRAQIYRPRPRYARMAPLHAASEDLRGAPTLQLCVMRLSFAASLSKLSVLCALRRQSSGFPAVRAGVVKAFRRFAFLFAENIFAA
ncbi:hypothetical protein [uncultured Cloacibacillus sp.]|uniref:hypothetical protein n=1 Tax=uncultured Cloacibacillus sp. TaxID=889794 RepID=UPI0026DD9882|nr:hypothetical protein [uncultured Cloacibacillus sp.]